METELQEVFRRALKDGSIFVSDGGFSTELIQQKINQLKTLGIHPREAVGISFQNGAECTATYIACAMVDAVAMPLPPTLPDLEKERLWKRLGCKIIADSNGMRILDEVPFSPTWPSDIFWVLHSSGSTGIPKAIPVTLDAIKQNAKDVMNTLDLGTRFTHIGCMSQCYTSGLYNSFMLPLLTGGKSIIGPVVSALKVLEFVKILKKYNPEILWLNPTVLTLLRKRSVAEDVKNVRAIISCTAPLLKEECLESEKHFNVPVLQSYGLTETMIVSLEKVDREADKEFSAGAIVGGKSCLSVDSSGLLVIHNNAVMYGYASLHQNEIVFEMPAHCESKKAFASGDLGILNEKNYLALTGRLTNVINVEGVKISAELLEQVVLEFQNIQKAVAIGLPDSNGREKPVLLLQSNSEVNTFELAQHCVSKLGPKARPFKFLFTESIPITSNGKIDRVAARELTQSLLAFGEK